MVREAMEETVVGWLGRRRVPPPLHPSVFRLRLALRENERTSATRRRLGDTGVPVAGIVTLTPAWGCLNPSGNRTSVFFELETRNFFSNFLVVLGQSGPYRPCRRSRAHMHTLKGVVVGAQTPRATHRPAERRVISKTSETSRRDHLALLLLASLPLVAPSPASALPGFKKDLNKGRKLREKVDKSQFQAGRYSADARPTRPTLTRATSLVPQDPTACSTRTLWWAMGRWPRRDLAWRCISMPSGRASRS